MILKGSYNICDGRPLKDRAGTPKYMAPEVRNGQSYGLKADIYSLGVIAKEIFRMESSR